MQQVRNNPQSAAHQGCCCPYEELLCFKTLTHFIPLALTYSESCRMLHSRKSRSRWQSFWWPCTGKKGEKYPENQKFFYVNPVVPLKTWRKEQTLFWTKEKKVKRYPVQVQDGQEAHCWALTCSIRILILKNNIYSYAGQGGSYEIFRASDLHFYPFAPNLIP